MYRFAVFGGMLLRSRNDFSEFEEKTPVGASSIGDLAHTRPFMLREYVCRVGHHPNTRASHKIAYSSICRACSHRDTTG